MTKTYKITNGTEATIDFCEYTNEYVMHHYDFDSIFSMGRFDTIEQAESRLRRIAKAWGGFEVIEA